MNRNPARPTCVRRRNSGPNRVQLKIVLGSYETCASVPNARKIIIIVIEIVVVVVVMSVMNVQGDGYFVYRSPFVADNRAEYVECRIPGAKGTPQKNEPVLAIVSFSAATNSRSIRFFCRYFIRFRFAHGENGAREIVYEMSYFLRPFTIIRTANDRKFRDRFVFYSSIYFSFGLLQFFESCSSLSLLSASRAVLIYLLRL